jgi:hypothetical protein
MFFFYFSFFFVFMAIVGIVQVFVDHPSYHRPGSLYGDNFGAFGDNQVIHCYAELTI